MSNYNPNQQPQNYAAPQNQNPYTAPQQPQYGAPAPNYAPQPNYYTPAPVTADTMSIGAWIGTLILSCIPVVGLICLIVWCCSSDPAKKSRKNWAIAQLIIAAVMIVLMIILGAVLSASIASIVNSLW